MNNKNNHMHCMGQKTRGSRNIHILLIPNFNCVVEMANYSYHCWKIRPLFCRSYYSNHTQMNQEIINKISEHIIWCLHLHHLGPKLITTITIVMVHLTCGCKAKLIIRLEVLFHLQDMYQNFPNSTSTILGTKFITVI